MGVETTQHFFVKVDKLKMPIITHYKALNQIHIILLPRLLNFLFGMS